jgi:hypothetical protein
MFTNVSDYLDWVHEMLGISAKEAGKTYGMSLIVVAGVIMAVSIPAVIGIVITHFLHKRREQSGQPGFVQSSQRPVKREMSPGREESGEPEFVRRARERQREGK